MDLTEILAPISADMARTDRVILESLDSDVLLIRQLGHYIVASGGKRLRPALVLMSARACGYTGDLHINMATAIEFVHTATLLHDDVVDSSRMRRGRDTANEIWGNEAAVLVGDFIYSRAFQLMVSSNNMRILSLLANASNTIAAGEVIQLGNAHDPDISEQQYLDVIARKTSTLFRAGCEIGGILGGMDETQVDALGRYGMHLGNAFQLVDDLLDYHGDTSLIGKNVGDDLADGKTTLPLIHAIRNGSDEQAGLIRRAIREGDNSRIAEIVHAIESTGAMEYTSALAKRESRAAVEALETLPQTPFREAMIDLAGFAVARTY